MPLGTEVDLSPDHIVLDGDSAPRPAKGAQQPPPPFRSMSIVAKRSPISSTAELSSAFTYNLRSSTACLIFSSHY